jgi:hypothetical protein
VNRLLPLVLLAVLTACSDNQGSSTETETPPTIGVNVQVDGERLVVSGSAKVPDGTPVVLLVGRNVKFAKDDVPRSTTIAKGDTAVDGGTFHATLLVDESELVFDANGKRYGKIEIVSDSVTACAQVKAQGSNKPVEAIATTTFPSTVLPDLKAALGKPPRRENRVGQAFCAIEKSTTIR